MNDLKRLDLRMVERGVSSSRERAKELILQGLVSVNGKRVLKPAFPCAQHDVIETAGQGQKYVGRGGLKLERALDVFGVDPVGKCVVDIGASTGGFTQCLLMRGARKVYAVDVGRGQLAPCLLDDDRVVNMEGCNIRHMDAAFFDERPEMAVCDVSFISLRHVLPAAHAIIKPGGDMIALIKPQFEAGRENVGKNGIIKYARIHIKVLRDIIETARYNSFTVVDITPSPIRGGDGNIEFLAMLTMSGGKAFEDVESVVKNAHELNNLG